MPTSAHRCCIANIAIPAFLPSTVPETGPFNRDPHELLLHQHTISPLSEVATVFLLVPPGYQLHRNQLEYFGQKL